MIRDLDYLKDDKIGKVLAQGMAELFKKQPEFPIHYFGNWLLNYEKQEAEKMNEVEKMKQRETKLQQVEQRLNDEKLMHQQQELLKQQQLDQENQFQDMIKGHQYHEELLLSELPNHIEHQAHLSGVYIGKVDYPDHELDIENDDTEDGHLNKQKQKVIKYIGSSESHDFLNGSILNPDQGITWNVFKLQEILNKKTNPEDGEQNIMNDTTIEFKENYLYVKNVVENGNIYYHRIPQLGGYMAIPLVYESSLTEESFDQALLDRHLYLQELEQQQKERQEQEQEYQEKLKEMEDNNEDTTDFVNQWEEGVKQRQDVEEKEFTTFQQQYVVCCDTMGQDKGIDSVNIEYLIKIVQMVGQSWETNEAKNLKNDIDIQMQYLNSINNDYTAVVQKFSQEEEQVVEAAVGDQDLDEKQVTYEQENARWSKLIEQLQQDTVKEYVRTLARFRVLKFSQLLQAILLFLGYHKEQVNVKGTNILDWKNVKQMLNDEQFFNKIQSYNYKGAKPEQVKDYVKIKRLSNKLKQWNVDEIDKYNVGLGRIYRWITLSLKLRNLDIELRREHKVKMDQEREEKIKAEEERQKEKEAAFQEHKASLMADELEAFNEEEWRLQYDSQNPVIEIPEVLEDDIDNDLEDE